MSLYLSTLCVLSFCSISHLSFTVYAVHFLGKSLPFPLSGEKHILFWHWSKLSNEERDYNWWRIRIHLSTSQIIYWFRVTNSFGPRLSLWSCCNSYHILLIWLNLGFGGNWGQDFEALSNFPKAKLFKMSNIGQLKLGICQLKRLFTF